MQSHIITDWSEARRLWERFVDPISLYDSFDLRETFCRAEEATPYFILAKFDCGTEALLALQQSGKARSFVFFGGGYMEDNSVYPRTLTADRKRALLDSVPDETALYAILSSRPEEEELNFEEYKYVLDLTKAQSAENYLNTSFDSKSRANFRKRLRNASSFQPTLRRGGAEDLKRLFELNILRFGSESIFHRPERRLAFLNLLHVPMEVIVFAFEIAGTVEAVSISVLWNGYFTYLNAGVNVESYSNLGTLVIFENLQQAFLSHAHTFDAGPQDLGWKERWHLDRRPLYIYPTRKPFDTSLPSIRTAISIGANALL